MSIFIMFSLCNPIYIYICIYTYAYTYSLEYLYIYVFLDILFSIPFLFSFSLCSSLSVPLSFSLLTCSLKASRFPSLWATTPTPPQCPSLQATLLRPQALQQKTLFKDLV